MDSAPPTPPAAERKLNPGVLLLIAILAMVFFIIGLLNLLAQNLLRLRRARRRVGDAAAGAPDGSSPTALQGQLRHLFHLHDAGVDQAFIDALPVFLYRNVVGDEDGAGKDPFDCAVCLCEFSPEDQLRLLPKCSHAFHLECIDTWLLSHSTCPLCRRSLLAAELSPTCSPVVMVLESDSTRDDMAVAAARATDDADADAEPTLAAQEGAEEEVVEVKLGKFMCLDANAKAADGAGTSGGGDGDGSGKEGLGQRRCHSMGSYEYVMDDRAALRVAIKPPPRKKPGAVSKSRRRGAMSECEFGASKRGETSSLRLPFPVHKHHQQSDAGTAKLAKDSFSVSKTWMVPPPSRKDPEAAAGERRAVSFRWPVSSSKEEEGGGEGGKERKSGSEADWDVEAGSCGGNSAVSEERPSFARRTLLWVVGGRQHQSSRVGSCS